MHDLYIYINQISYLFVWYIKKNVLYNKLLDCSGIFIPAVCVCVRGGEKEMSGKVAQSERDPRWVQTCSRPTARSMHSYLIATLWTLLYHLFKIILLELRANHVNKRIVWWVVGIRAGEGSAYDQPTNPSPPPSQPADGSRDVICVCFTYDLVWYYIGGWRGQPELTPGRMWTILYRNFHQK